MSNVVLDGLGNIDTEKLSKELQNALEFDIAYKRTDNMKKKAVKIAKDYDEFKNFVACAHLKTLSRKEVESLGTPKKGWQKSSGVRKVNAKVLIQEQNVENLQSVCQISKGTTFRKPKTSLELDRDWRRLSDDLKLGYMIRVGLPRMQKLLQTDCDATFIEDVLRILIDHASSIVQSDDTTLQQLETIDTMPSGSSVTANESARPQPTSDAQLPEEKQAESEPASTAVTDEDMMTKENILVWLKAITTFQRFNLNIKFIETSLKTKIITWLTSECTGHDSAQDLIGKYS